MSVNAWRQDFAESPYFSGLAAHAGHFSRFTDWPGLADLNQRAVEYAASNASGQPLRFGEQTQRCSQRDYEHGIHASGQVPTRPASWHDFFNALIWLAWPRAKAALNSVQNESLNTPGDQRGPISDAATLFDESGLVLVAPDAGIAALLRAKQWRQAFWEARPAWQAARLYVFGHSLLEKSLQPAPGMTGKCLFIKADTRAIPAASVPAWLDERVALDWECRRIMRPSDLFALPIQGVPGFDAASCSADYYADERIFRPARIKPSTAPI